MGDNVYADAAEIPNTLDRQLHKLSLQPGFSALKQNSKFHITWNDHDYGQNNAGKEYRLKENSKGIHRRFWDLESQISADQDSVYYSEIEPQANGQKIQFIMLDVRFNRDKPGKDGDTLGQDQWEWLELQLIKEADLRFVVSGYQILLDKSTKWEASLKLVSPVKVYLI